MRSGVGVLVDGPATPTGAAASLSYYTKDAEASLAGSHRLAAQRVTTGSIAMGATADVTLTWVAAFPDANYTPMCQVLEAGANLTCRLKSYSATQVVATVTNLDGANAHTGTLMVVGVHD